MKNTVAQFQEFALPQQTNVKRIVWVGLSVLLCLVSLYVYFVGKIVFDVVGRRTAEASIRSSQSAISSASADYFNHLKTLTLAQAGSVGLTASKDTLYASRTVASGKTVGMLTN